jgi:hypothetical protein
MRVAPRWLLVSSGPAMATRMPAVVSASLTSVTAGGTTLPRMPPIGLAVVVVVPGAGWTPPASMVTGVPSTAPSVATVPPETTTWVPSVVAVRSVTTEPIVMTPSTFTSVNSVRLCRVIEVPAKVVCAVEVTDPTLAIAGVVPAGIDEVASDPVRSASTRASNPGAGADSAWGWVPELAVTRYGYAGTVPSS